MENHIIETDDVIGKKPVIEEPAERKDAIVKAVVSLGLYMGVYFFLFRQNLQWVLILVAVMLLHEAGHFIAMKLLGYKDVRMFFVPFLGAFVSGSPDTISQRQRTITLLAGPIPGIFAGVVFLILHYSTGNSLFYQLSLMLILLNAFNLLPVSPLDGGQLLENLFFYSGRVIQQGFIILSAILLFYLAVITRNYFVLLIVWLLVLRLRNMNAVNAVRRSLEKEGISYHTTYEELSDEAYCNIRQQMIFHIKKLRAYDPDIISDDEGRVIGWMNKILTGHIKQDMSINEKIAVTVLWILALIVPVFLFLDKKMNLHSWF
ncbi:MAG: site-2 protease family protein [Chitinophagaceae bacterium]|nr:site-2 protease family protein [Chitinophagaceae bacterium]